ncbi:MAG: HpaII family restriction endonuclease [Mycoplasmatales bacterium]
MVDDNFKNISDILLKYSIKSYFKSKPTLINSSKHTNIKYELKNCTYELMDIINNISSRRKLMDRYIFCKENNIEIVYDSVISETFLENLKMVDTTFPQILAYKLLDSYNDKTKNFIDLITGKLEIFQFMKFIEYFGLSAFPSKEWDGKIVVNGGFIEVEKDLSIKILDLVYDKENILNNMFENLKFDSPSTTRYNMFEVFKENDSYYITLNVQIRYR